MRSSSAKNTATRAERILGIYEGPRPGRTFVAIGGMHGNEPAGLFAVQSVLRTLERQGTELAGTLIGLAGNLAALAANERYLDHDLNRGWTTDECARVRQPHPGESPEDVEQRELLEIFDRLEAESDEPLCFFDLHSTSGPAAPFSVIPDVARCRTLALSLPIPTVLGLEEILEGVMFGYLADRGHMGVAVEGGQHQEPETAARLEAVVWLTLVSAGALREDQVPNFQEHHRRLERSAAGLPAAVRVIFRHGLADDDPFEMIPGFDNFSPIDKGQAIAHGPDGPILAAEKGLVMLPRYQGLGNDGFFLATRVTSQWLAMSAAARRTNMERLLSLWPGLTWNASEPNRAPYDGPPPPRAMLRALRLLGFHGVRSREDSIEFFRRRP